jgi:hypothetical protein
MLKWANYISKKFGRNQQGSVAIETSIILPLILIPVTLATVDVGIAINSGQSLTSASRSGTQYLLNGGRIENDLKSVIVDAYNGTLERGHIIIETSCACPDESAIPSGEPEQQQDGTIPLEEQAETAPYELRNVTLATMDNCSTACSDSSSERVLVNLNITSTSNGLYKSYPLQKEISVRVK